MSVHTYYKHACTHDIYSKCRYEYTVYQPYTTDMCAHTTHAPVLGCFQLSLGHALSFLLLTFET